MCNRMSPIIDVHEATIRFDGTSACASVVIGADGVNGLTARALGFANRRHGVALEGNVSYVHAREERWRGRAVVDLAAVPGGYAWVFPKGDHVNVGVGGWVSEGPRLREHLERACSAYGLPHRRLESLRGYRLPMRRAGEAPLRGRVMLVGDAAGLVDPLSGDGIYEALLSSRLACEAALDLLAGRRANLEPYRERLANELDPLNLFTLQQIANNHILLQQYADAKLALNRALVFEPNDPETIAASAWIDLEWKADVQPLHQAVAAMRLNHSLPPSRIADGWLICALAERDAAAAKEALIASDQNTALNDQAIHFSRSFVEGLIGRMTNDEAKARAAFASARETLAAAEKKSVLPPTAPECAHASYISARMQNSDQSFTTAMQADPDGSMSSIGSLPPYTYRLIPPLYPTGSVCRNRPSVAE